MLGVARVRNRMDSLQYASEALKNNPEFVLNGEGHLWIQNLRDNYKILYFLPENALFL